MYNNKESVNILTTLLVCHGVKHAVVCPGSRNAPIVHNMNECPDIECYPVTDERSAGFYALGMAQALHEPVAVCVTSGSALLNVAPAVAEAKYQHVPLVVISADRPQQWIDQLDGQTLPQPGALGGLVAKSVSLPVYNGTGDEETHWYCNRLVNEALLALPSCVHINVPILEPLFEFTTPQLPSERIIERMAPPADYSCLRPDFIESLIQAERPMIVFGQASIHDFSGQDVEFLFSHVIVLHESLAPFPSISHFDEVLAKTSMPAPDFVIHIGNAIVSKRLKKFLRQAKDAQVWRISPSGDVEDTFQHLRGIIVGDPELIIQAISQKLRNRKLCGMEYRRHWLTQLTKASQHTAAFTPAYSQMAAVRCFEARLATLGQGHAVHYANSTAIRLANIYAPHHVWCNRGVNGIEGSLSTAAGFSVIASASGSLTFCVIGDLSFFYDQNALWNQNLHSCFRILLLNNGKGGIFDMLPGLTESPAHDRLVSARHDTTAEGICHQNGIDYLSADNMDTLLSGIEWLTMPEANRCRLLEVHTDAATDCRILKEYLDSLFLP